jgi:carboxypeptidase Taq
MPNAASELTRHLAPILRLQQAAAILAWDQQTTMPVGGAPARAEQLAALSEQAHSLFTGDGTRQRLATAEQEEPSAQTWVVRRDFDQATKIPGELVAHLSRETALAHVAWERARATNDFATFAPSLERVLELTRQQAAYLGGEPYDALLDLYEPGMTADSVASLFDDLRPFLVNLATHASLRPTPTAVITRPFPIEAQRKLTAAVAREIGFDFSRGRQDESAHPFCTTFSQGDVRITTRYDEKLFTQALYGTIHETGHALYEQGVDPAYEGTILSGGVSLGVHESQSRFWENIVGRSLPFCRWLLPHLRSAAPARFDDVTPETLYAAITAIQPSPIRVEADEVTYNLHILLRFELERKLLEGSLRVVDLPEAWNAKMREYLDVTPANDSVGVLQDVHWSGGLIGYFPTYTLGNLLSAQLWETMRMAVPDHETLIETGKFAPLLAWLREHVHTFGRSVEPNELIVQATGKPLSTEAYKQYLDDKYPAS